MSDYLWDKSGEPEAEVERLEELLGSLRHTRSAPELPFEVETHASTRAGFLSGTSFPHPARLAVAAALLLAVLAGAFVMLRSSSKSDGRAASNAAQVTQPRASATGEVRAPEVAASPTEKPAAPEKTQPVHRGELAEAKALQKLERREVLPRETVANEQPRRVFKPALARGEGFDGGAFDVQSRLRAKEQLVYAMRLTSEALKEVRGRASGVDARANAFDGRSPPR
jgi:hypothetical protein